jgi:glycerophosphoryl diester phosphodiesterase
MLILLKIIKGLSFLAISGVVIFSGFYAYLSSSNGKPAEDFKIFAEKHSKPLIFAHRGGRGIAPENTLTAFRRSFELGVDVLELDIHASKDGELVVIHDRSVDRTTDGKGLVAEKNFAELEKLDAGYNWTNDGGKTFPFRGQGVKIPTLREVFEEFPNTIINIEPKHDTPSPVKPLCDLIIEFKRTDKVIVGSFHDGVLEDFRQNCKEVATSASPSEASGFLARYEVGLDDNYTPKMQALQIPQRIGSFEIVTRDYLKAARKKHLQVHVWTINKTEDMKRLIDLGVDGIMTDYPDRLLEILKKD